MPADSLGYKPALYAGDEFLRHLDPQVATRHHDTVGHVENLVDVVHTLLVLDFSNDTDVASGVVEQTAHFEHVLAAAHKRMSDKSDVSVNGKADIRLVPFRQGGEVDTHARHVDTFPRP